MERKFEKGDLPKWSIALLWLPIQARPQWDLVCEMDHGCAPIPVTRAMSGALQRTDPRCRTQTVSPEDAEALKQLNEVLKPLPER
jgi:hypothetical protein